MPVSELKNRKVATASLKHYRANPRQGDVGAIVESLKHHGQYRPIVVNERTSEVLAGNHTLKAARELGWNDIEVTFVDVDDDQAARIVLVDNRSNDLAAYDDQALADLLRTLPDLEGTGFSGDDLDELLTVLDPVERKGTDTEPSEPPDDPRTAPGTLYQLGDHRLICGDATDGVTVARLLGDVEPAVVFTDPPYGISYEDLKKSHRPIANDDINPSALVRDALALLGVDPKAPFYVCCDWRSLESMRHALIEVGVQEKALIVWDKTRGVQNLDRYFKQHEFILYAGPYGGEKTLSGDVWQIPREPNPGDHPTPKPVALIERALSDASGSTVADPFGGSGSTLIAAENLGRVAYLIELDPAYCDVIVDRWERHTGKKAELADG